METRLTARWRIGAAIAASVVSLCAAPAAQAEVAPPTTSVYVLHVDAQPIDNRCNGDTVVLHGDLTIITTTTPTRGGGRTVQGATVGRNLAGYGLPSGLTYKAVTAELSFARELPAPGNGSFTDTQWWLLVPRGAAPVMYLVMVLRETVNSDGSTTTVLDRTSVVCGATPQR